MRENAEDLKFRSSVANDGIQTKYGSRNADGNVPNVNWNPDNGNLNVNWYSSGNANANLRSRSEVSKITKSPFKALCRLEIFASQWPFWRFLGDFLAD
jgi:hypothetical protein